jgi:WD40 repeat protein
MTDAARESQCPYPGLEAFTAENRHFFFGRTSDTQLLISNLYASALTVVYGSSGVGKTSVILAGVVPEIERAGEAAIVVHRTWQDAGRARSLGERLVQAVAEKLGTAPMAADAPLDVLAERLAAAWRRPIFLVFDQFEEYFLYNEPSDDPDSLDGELARLINRRDIEVNVMIVMREDSIAALDRFRHRIPTLLNNLYRLEHLTPDEARSAIEEPLAVLRSRALAEDQLPTTIEPGLSTAILDDLAALDRAAPLAGGVRAAARVELPFLQVVLERIWLTECRSRSPLVRGATFTGAGGARGIVRERVEESLNTLDAAEQRIVASVLRHLVTPSGSKIALTMADLTGYAGVSDGAVSAAVQRLTSSDARILRQVTHPSGDPTLTKYEIYHDALGAPLLAWRLVMDRRRDEGERRSRRRVRDIIVGLGVLVVAAIALADSQRKGRHRVEARELAATATGQLESDNGRALLLAIESINRSADQNEGEVALRRTLFEPGERFRDTVSAPMAGTRVSLTVSPNGQYVVATFPQRGVALWGTDSLQRVTIPNWPSAARSASFDATSRYLLLVDGRRARVFDLTSRHEVGTIPPRGGSVPTGHLMRGGNRALMSYNGVGLVEWTLTDSVWRETARTPPGESVIQELIVSPDDGWAAWLRDGKLAIVDLQTRPWVVRRLAVNGERIVAVGITSPNTFAVATESDTLAMARFFDAHTLKEYERARLSCRVRDLAIANELAVGACSLQGLIPFNLPGAGRQALLGDQPPMANRPGAYTSAQVSPDGRFAAGIMQGESSPTVWSVFGRREATRLRGHRGDVKALAFLPDSRSVITVGTDSTIRKWELVSASQRIGDGEWASGSANIALSESAMHAAIVSPYGVQLWDLAREAVEFEAVVTDPNGVLAIAPSGDRVWTLSIQERVEEFGKSYPRGRELWVAPPRAPPPANQGRYYDEPSYDESSIMLYAGRDRGILLTTARVNPNRVRPTIQHIAPAGTRELAHFDAWINGMAADLSGRIVVIVLDDGEVVLRSLTDSSVSERLTPHLGAATAVAIGPDLHVASAGREGDVHLAAPRAGSLAAANVSYAPAMTLGKHDRSVVSLTFNKSGSVLASGDDGGTVRLWNSARHVELCSLEGQQSDAITAVAFAPSGALVATADERSVVLWFVDEQDASCRFAYRLADLETPAKAMRFAGDGSALIIVGRDGIIRRYLRPIWAPRDSLLTLAKRRLRGRKLTAAEEARYLNAK